MNVHTEKANNHTIVERLKIMENALAEYQDVDLPDELKNILPRINHILKELKADINSGDIYLTEINKINSEIWDYQRNIEKQKIFHVVSKFFEKSECKANETSPFCDAPILDTYDPILKQNAICYAIKIPCLSEFEKLNKLPTAKRDKFNDLYVQLRVHVNNSEEFRGFLGIKKNGIKKCHLSLKVFCLMICLNLIRNNLQSLLQKYFCLSQVLNIFISHC